MKKLLLPNAAAEASGLKVATLAKLRVKGSGPPFKRIGGRVMYPEQELNEWLDSKPLLRSTSERPAEP